MKFSLRAGFVAVALAASLAQAATSDPALSGCWRSTQIVMHFQGGTQSEDRTGRCTLQYRDDQLESSCATSGGSAVSTYRYEVVRPNVYLATMTGSSFRTGMLGSSREYEYRIEGDRLRLVTSPPANAPASPLTPVRVESESQRVPCQAG